MQWRWGLLTSPLSPIRAVTIPASNFLRGRVPRKMVMGWVLLHTQPTRERCRRVVVYHAHRTGEAY